MRAADSTRRYLSMQQVAARLGIAPSTLSRYKLPTPDVVIGPLADDDTIPRGTVRGWLPETIDEWNRNRPGRGARTDLRDDDSGPQTGV